MYLDQNRPSQKIYRKNQTLGTSYFNQDAGQAGQGATQNGKRTRFADLGVGPGFERHIDADGLLQGLNLRSIGRQRIGSCAHHIDHTAGHENRDDRGPAGRAKNVTGEERHLHYFRSIRPLPLGLVKGQKLSKTFFPQRQRNLLLVSRPDAEGKPFFQLVRPWIAIHEYLRYKSELVLRFPMGSHFASRGDDAKLRFGFNPTFTDPDELPPSRLQDSNSGFRPKTSLPFRSVPNQNPGGLNCHTA